SSCERNGDQLRRRDVTRPRKPIRTREAVPREPRAVAGKERNEARAILSPVRAPLRSSPLGTESLFQKGAGTAETAVAHRNNLRVPRLRQPWPPLGNRL